MASADQITALRAMIDDSTQPYTYSDSTLNSLIDAAAGDLNRVAYDIWTAKAASAASFVDISEGGSSRKAGDLYEQYIAMANVFGSRVADGSVPGGRVTRVSKLRR